MPSELDLDLIHASTEGDLASVRDLLAADVNIRGENGVTALFVAAVNGQADMVNVLLDAHADPNVLAARIESVQPVRAANGHAGESETPDFAPAKAAATGEIGTSPLMVAALHGHATVVEELLAAGADRKISDASGATALQAAAMSGHAHYGGRLVGWRGGTRNRG